MESCKSSVRELSRSWIKDHTLRFLPTFPTALQGCFGIGVWGVKVLFFRDLMQEGLRAKHPPGCFWLLADFCFGQVGAACPQDCCPSVGAGGLSPPVALNCLCVCVQTSLPAQNPCTPRPLSQSRLASTHYSYQKLCVPDDRGTWQTASLACCT